MKKLLLFCFVLFLSFTGLNAQIAPAEVCTSPASYAYDQEVTWYFDLTGNTLVTSGEDLYFYSWAPNPPPGGSVLMTHESDMIWSLTFTPTTFYGLTAAEIQAVGDAAFWSNVQNAGGTAVTGTIPYPQKELLRLGNSCAGVITLSSDSFNVDNIKIYTINTSTLRIDGMSTGKSRLTLVNISGKQVLNSSFISEGSHDFRLPNLTSGIYIVQLENENGTLIKKIALE